MGFRQGPVENLAVTGRTRVSEGFFQGKRVLLTGHTGFKGSWLALWLHRLGATVTGVSLPPNSQPNLFSLAGIEECCDSHFLDIRDRVALDTLIKHVQPEIVFHLAAQPLVRTSYREPVTTFATNVMGTVHVLEALRGLEQTRVAVMVTTDKVYRNEEQQRPFREDDALGGRDPYSASKAASEMVIASYRDAFLAEQSVAVASARAGNVIGGGDWSQDRLIPDAVRAWQEGQTLEVRRPNAIRPWQHVLEPLAGYLILAEKLWQQSALAGAYNLGPETKEAATVRDVVEMACNHYGRGEVCFGNGSDGPHETEWLALDIAKSAHSLGVKPRWTLTESIENTMSWYRACSRGGGARDLCEKQIAEYESPE